MKIPGLLALVLLLLVLSSSLSLFVVPNQVFNQVSGGAPSLVVFGKQDYVYARVQLTITPFLAGNQQLSIYLPDGTSRQITSTTTINIVYPNTIYYSGMISTGGAEPCIAIGSASPLVSSCVHIPALNETGTSCDVSPSRPLCLTSFPVDRPTPSYASTSEPIPGVHTYTFLINGTGSFNLQMQMWGVSL
jgi:hypothetical protein